MTYNGRENKGGILSVMKKLKAKIIKHLASLFRVLGVVDTKRCPDCGTEIDIYGHCDCESSWDDPEDRCQ